MGCSSLSKSLCIPGFQMAPLKWGGRRHLPAGDLRQSDGMAQKMGLARAPAKRRSRRLPSVPAWARAQRAEG